MATEMSKSNLHERLRLAYAIFCEDVRLEVDNKLSLMGVFQNVAVGQLPITLIKFAVVHRWEGEGTYTAEVRVLTPDRQQFVVASQPARFEIEPGGSSDGVNIFVNVTFYEAGRYWVQTLVDSTLFDERPLLVTDMSAAPQRPDDTSEAVN